MMYSMPFFVTGDAIGDAMFMGRGAGKMPTASAVCGDIIDVARNIIHKSNGRINCTCFDENISAVWRI